MLETLLSIVQVFICIVLIFLVLMHSGKDAGLSGAFGVGTGSGPLGGGSLVERNLNRWTIFFRIVFGIPAYVFATVLGTVVYVIAILGWFGSLALVRMPNEGQMGVQDEREITVHYATFSAAGILRFES